MQLNIFEVIISEICLIQLISADLSNNSTKSLELDMATNTGNYLKNTKRLSRIFIFSKLFSENKRMSTKNYQQKYPSNVKKVNTYEKDSITDRYSTLSPFNKKNTTASHSISHSNKSTILSGQINSQHYSLPENTTTTIPDQNINQKESTERLQFLFNKDTQAKFFSTTEAVTSESPITFSKLENPEISSTESYVGNISQLSEIYMVNSTEKSATTININMINKTSTSYLPSSSPFSRVSSKKGALLTSTNSLMNIFKSSKSPTLEQRRLNSDEMQNSTKLSLKIHRNEYDITPEIQNVFTGTMTNKTIDSQSLFLVANSKILSNTVKKENEIGITLLPFTAKVKHTMNPQVNRYSKISEQTLKRSTPKFKEINFNLTIIVNTYDIQNSSLRSEEQSNQILNKDQNSKPIPNILLRPISKSFILYHEVFQEEKPSKKSTRSFLNKSKISNLLKNLSTNSKFIRLKTQNAFETQISTIRPYPIARSRQNEKFRKAMEDKNTESFVNIKETKPPLTTEMNPSNPLKSYFSSIKKPSLNIRNHFFKNDQFDPICILDKDEGYGSDSFSSWYFNTNNGKCEWFSYHGNGGNGNRFYYRANCEHSCIEPYSNFCLRKDVINCSENWLRCTMESDILCESKAENRKDGMKCPPKQPICINKRFNIRKPPDYLLHQSLIPTECYLSKDHGQCNQDNSSPLMYYYDAKFNDCFGFLYSKCGGNLNKFSNKSDCMNRCAI